jgi:DNA (cytosine-5)-methyltransferase 1
MTGITLGSLFDGIGGFPLAAERNGIAPIWASEIEPFPIRVTKTRFPNMLHVGDITKLDGAKLQPVEIISGGSPCQDLSVAGKRAGLAGARSGLFMEQIRVIKEMRAEDEQNGRTGDLCRPRYMVWENVPGAFSSAGGEDFRAVLEETCRIADGSISVPRPPGGVWLSAGTIMGVGFSVSWRVLDAQYWTLAQRRKRIFLVADFGGHTAPKILFEQDSLFGNTAQGAKTREGAAADPEAGPGDPGGRPAGREGRNGECVTPWDVQSRRIYEINGVWPALYGGEGGGHGYVSAENNNNITTPISTQTALRQNQSGETTPGVGENGGTAPALPVTADTGRIAFTCNQRDEVRDLHDVSAAVQAQPGMKQQTFIASVEKTDPLNPDETANCLTPWDTQQERIFTGSCVSPTLTGADGGGGRNPAGLLFAAGVVSKGDGDCFLTPEKHTSLTSGGGQAGQGYPCVLTAAFSAGASPKAGGIGYQEECSPTLKASESGTNMVPSVLCLNDQGGNRMDVNIELTGTLRAQMAGHQPLVLATQQGGAEICEDLCPSITAAAGMSGNNQPVLFENHGIDARYTGSLDVAPTISARFGTGGNNVPLTMNVPVPRTFSLDGVESNSMKSPNPHSGCRETELARTIDTTNLCPGKNQGGIAIVQESYCIAGNIIDRQDKNGGNGIGVQKDVSYTLNTCDRHSVFSMQRSDIYTEKDVTSTQSARQYKDATDLVCSNEVAGVDCRSGSENGDLCGTLQSHTSGGYSLNTLHPVRVGKYVRRLTPLECERLMGFPDVWTALEGATDSARYKALGNSVAIPCVTFVLRGIAYFMRKSKESGSEK